MIINNSLTLGYDEKQFSFKDLKYFQNIESVVSLLMTIKELVFLNLEASSRSIQTKSFFTFNRFCVLLKETKNHILSLFQIAKGYREYIYFKFREEFYRFFLNSLKTFVAIKKYIHHQLSIKRNIYEKNHHHITVSNSNAYCVCSKSSRKP